MILPLNRPEDDPDAQLMVRVRDGEPDLFGELVRRYQPRVAGLIQHFQPAGSDVEDLMQRVFLQAFRSRESYRPTARFSTWLFVITRNVVLNDRRSAARRKEVSWDAGDGEFLQRSDRGCDPVDAAILAESRQQVHAAIDQLGDRQRQVIRMVCLDGQRYRVAAERLKVSEKAVKSLVHRAKTNLKAHLQS